MKTNDLRAAAEAALEALVIAEAGLADIGDADREPGDDLAWCEQRASEALDAPRKAIEQLRAALAEPDADWSLLKATQESLREHMAEIQRLRTALAEQQDAEPVAWMFVDDTGMRFVSVERPHKDFQPLYATTATSGTTDARLRGLKPR